MKKSIYVELIKIVKKRSFVIFVCSLFLITILLTLFLKNDFKREYIYIDESNYGNEYSEYIDYVNEENKITEYVLNNNIDEHNNIRGSLSVSHMILTFLSLYIVILGSKSFGYEYEKNTIKWIMLNNKKKTIFFSKIISLLIISIMLVSLVYFTNLFAVNIMYDVDILDLNVLLTKNGHIIEKSLLIVHSCEYLRLFFPQMLLIILSAFLGLLFKSSVASSAISIFILLSGSLVTELFIKLKLKVISYTFLPYLDFSIFQDRIGLCLYNIENAINITQKNGVIIIIISSILLMIMGSLIFEKRELK